jgi:HTH-type transcriptional regulator, transcriptional repressor of NAD biosynthesis genes
MSQAITRGFFLGKFLPPHEGHVMIGRAALELVDELTILVCSLEDDPIPGALRYEWMCELFPTARVIHHNKDIPQTPEDHPDFWRIWRETIIGLHPEPITHVFGSDPYIHQLGVELEATPVLLDPDREALAVSGTALRTSPFSNWSLIPDVVRPYFAKRVCIFGPESTGKSMLTKHLAEVFETLYMPEYGRIFDEQYRPDLWTPQHFVDIARTHEAMRRALMHKANCVLFEDTDAVLTTIWSDAFVGEVDPWFDRDFELADHYLLTDIDVPWVDDGLRVFGKEEERQAFFDKAKAALEERDATYTVLSGDWNVREAKAEAVVRALIDEGLSK